MTIFTKHRFDVSAHVQTAREAQRAAMRMDFTGCPDCGRVLSIAEIIEHHCENCERDIHPRAMRDDRRAA